MKINYSVGKAGIATLLLTVLTGCTTYVVQSPDPQPAYVPPPEPAQVYVQPAPPPPPPAPPAVVVIQREDDFYQPLSPYGEWVTVGDYGRCWRPAGVETGWRPYANGHWELTDDGWFWASDEPWAWATYHYGRWEQANNYGWIWVPQTQWAPAWVSWREGGGYVGWAPLPPERRGGVTVNVTIAPAAFCYVPETRMHEPMRPTTVIVNNTTIINKTVNITKTKVVNKVVINEGPRSDEVERATGRKIQKASVNDLRHQEEQPVADKHINLRGGNGNNGNGNGNNGPDQKQPSPRPVNRPQDLKTQDQHPTPVMQPPVHETEKPVRQEPTRPVRETEKPVLPEPAKPAPVKQPILPPPQPNRPRDVQVEKKNNQGQLFQKQTPPPTPAPARDVRPVEKAPAPISTDYNNRDRQPAKLQPQPSQAQPAPKAEKERANPPKQEKQLSPKNARPAPARNDNPRTRDPDNTNPADSSGQNGRHQ